MVIVNWRNVVQNSIVITGVLLLFIGVDGFSGSLTPLFVTMFVELFAER